MSVNGFDFDGTVHRYNYNSLDNIPPNIAPAYSASSTYAIGDYCTKDNVLYKCSTAISTAEAWNSAHWTQVQLATDVADLKDEIEQIEPGLSDEAKEALLACFRNVAWANENGQEYYYDLENALGFPHGPEIIRPIQNEMTYVGAATWGTEHETPQQNSGWRVATQDVSNRICFNVSEIAVQIGDVIQLRDITSDTVISPSMYQFAIGTRVPQTSYNNRSFITGGYIPDNTYTLVQEDLSDFKVLMVRRADNSNLTLADIGSIKQYFAIVKAE